MRSTVFLAAIATCLLVGCRMESTIRVERNGRTPVFVVTYDRGKPACIGGLAVTATASGKQVEVWAVQRAAGASDALCQGRLVYGVVPAGYEEVVVARPLVPTSLYEVAANGSSWGTSAPLWVW